jgi:hypothetical protein
LARAGSGPKREMSRARAHKTGKILFKITLQERPGARSESSREETGADFSLLIRRLPFAPLYRMS